MYDKCKYEFLTEREQIPKFIYEKFETLSENKWK